MARAFYEPRNRFVANSKMDEQYFKVWLVLYLRGLSVPQAIEKFNAFAQGDQKAPSAKTITNLFMRMGRYMFHTSFEPFLWEVEGDTAREHLDEGEEAYQAYLDETARKIIDGAQEAMSLDEYHALADSENTRKIGERITLELRALQVARLGGSDPRAHVGLAYMRALTPGSLSRTRVDEDHIEKMANFVLEKMVAFPMDEDGNTNQYLTYNPESRSLAGYGAFDKKYWATHGIWIDDWKKKQDQKKTQPKLGYIRTYLGDDSYEEQRQKLQDFGCTQIFEDINLTSECSEWPGLNELVAESSEYTTIVVTSFTRLGPLDDTWGKLMKTIWNTDSKIRIAGDGSPDDCEE
ncbi:recombinase family protein [Shimia sp. R9_3]|nr:recombinase family protein [Shimia sp. R9_3]